MSVSRDGTTRRASRRRGGDRAKAAGYEGFSLALTLMDLVPVVLFCVAGMLLGATLGSWLFVAGAVVCLAAGAGKVAWKLLIVTRGADVQPLTQQFRVLMPAGMALMVAALFVGPRTMSFAQLVAAALAWPAAGFLAAAVALLVVMGVLGVRGDRSSARDNWREELVNTAAQLCALLFVLSL